MRTLSKRKDAILLIITLAFAGSLAFVQLQPAFAVTRTYPVYSNCDFTNTGTGSQGGCGPTTGDLRVLSTGTGGTGSAVSAYMYGNPFSLSYGDYVTLSNIAASNVVGSMTLVSGDNVNQVHVVAYLDDPTSCTYPWRCQYQGISSQLYANTQFSLGTVNFSGARTGPSVSYNIVHTSVLYHHVVAYADATTQGTHNSYADVSDYLGSNFGAFNVKITETN